MRAPFVGAVHAASCHQRRCTSSSVRRSALTARRKTVTMVVTPWRMRCAAPQGTKTSSRKKGKAKDARSPLMSAPVPNI